ncbi:MAG: alpha/beta hydrolase [Clostridiales bacterium]|nr:alpha/beta hydrolase [Clostridiales bacterium]
MKEYAVHSVDLPNGERYAYRKAGAGQKTLLLLHGNMSSSVHWTPVMEELEGECTLIAPDLRGFGDSTYHAGFDSLAELAQDIAQFIDVLHLGVLYVCGWSTGGGVAMELAALRPAQVAGLLLIDSVPPGGYPMFKKDAAFQPIFSEPLTTKEEVAVDPVQVLPALTALRTGDRATMRYFWDLTIYHLNKPPEDEYAIYLDGIMKQRNLVDVDYALLTFRFADRIPLLTMPVTLFHGEKDMVVPLAWAQAALAQFGEKAELITFANAGHAPMTDAPDVFYRVLRESIEK